MKSLTSKQANVIRALILHGAKIMELHGPPSEIEIDRLGTGSLRIRFGEKLFRVEYYEDSPPVFFVEEVNDGGILSSTIESQVLQDILNGV